MYPVRMDMVIPSVGNIPMNDKAVTNYTNERRDEDVLFEPKQPKNKISEDFSPDRLHESHMFFP